MTMSDPLPSPGNVTEATAPERTKLMKGSRWPKDRYGDEIDVGDYLMFVNWCANYPTAALGKVCRIGKTGKVHVQLVKLHPKDEAREIEIKTSTSSRLSKAIVSSFMMEKLARE